MNRLSVRGRVSLTATVLAGLTLLVVSVSIVAMVETNVRAAAQDALVQALQDQAEELGGPSGFPAGRQTSFTLVVNGLTYQLGLFDELSEGNATGELVIDGELEKVLEIDLRTKKIVAVFDPSSNDAIDDPELRAQLEELTFEILDVDGDQGSTLLVGASALADIEASTTALRAALLVTIPLVVIWFGLMAWWLTGRALQPVMGITNQVEAISTKSLDRRVPVPSGGDEVARLASVMNQMLERLEAGDERQQQFSADASHELRSPLTTIRAAAEAIELNPDSDRTQVLAGHVVAETERMDLLISDLLELARLANGEPLPHILINLGHVAETVVDDSGVEIVATPDVMVYGDKKQLTRLMRNLVENAQRHAAQHVRVSVTKGDGVAVLIVEDDGPGIADDDRSKIFERFSRLDDDRSRKSGGSGLGLALARSIAEGHRGAITVDESDVLGGARFSVAIPLPDDGRSSDGHTGGFEGTSA